MSESIHIVIAGQRGIFYSLNVCHLSNHIHLTELPNQFCCHASVLISALLPILFLLYPNLAAPVAPAAPSIHPLICSQPSAYSLFALTIH